MAGKHSTPTGQRSTSIQRVGSGALSPSMLPVDTRNFLDHRLTKAHAIVVVACTSFGELSKGDVDDEAVMLSLDHVQRLLHQCRRHLEEVEELDPTTLHLDGEWRGSLVEASGLVDMLWHICWADGSVPFSGEIACDYLFAVETALEAAIDGLNAGGPAAAVAQRRGGVQ